MLMACRSTLGVATAAVLAGAVAAQAASLPDDASLLQPRDPRAATVGAGWPGQAAAGSGSGLDLPALDRALRIDTSPGQRNLDLLLEARGSADPAGDPLARRRTDLPAPVDAAAATAATPASPPASAVPRAPLVALAAEAGLMAQGGSGGGGGGAGTGSSGDGPSTRREWMGAIGGVVDNPSLLAGHARTQRLDAAATGDERRPGRGAPTYQIPLLGELRELVELLRENRFWVLGGLVLLALSAASLQAATRRR